MLMKQWRLLIRRRRSVCVSWSFLSVGNYHGQLKNSCFIQPDKFTIAMVKNQTKPPKPPKSMKKNCSLFRCCGDCMPSRMGEPSSSYSSSSSSQIPANSLYVCSLCLHYLKLFFSLIQYSLNKNVIVLNTSSLVHLPACCFSGRGVSLSHTCLAKLLLPWRACCCPVLLFPYSLPVCRQKSCPSWVLKREFELGQLVGRVRRDKGSENQGGHEQKSWDWCGRVRRERAVCWSKLLDPAFAQLEETQQVSGASSCTLF